MRLRLVCETASTDPAMTDTEATSRSISVKGTTNFAKSRLNTVKSILSSRYAPTLVPVAEIITPTAEGALAYAGGIHMCSGKSATFIASPTVMNANAVSTTREPYSSGRRAPRSIILSVPVTMYRYPMPSSTNVAPTVPSTR